MLGRAGEHPRLDAIGHLVAFAPSMASKESSQPIGGKALAPAIDVAVTAIELGANLGPRPSFRQQQDHSRMSRRIGSTVPRTGLSLQFHQLGLGQFHRRDCTSYSCVTVGYAIGAEPRALGLR